MSFKSEVQGYALNIKCESTIDLQEAEAIAQVIKTETEAAGKVSRVVIDLSGKIDMSHNTMKVFSPIGLNLRKKEILIYVLNPPKKVSSLINQLGMASLLHPVEIVEEIPNFAPGPKTKPKAGINVAFINPFVEGTLMTLKVQCGIECKPGKPMPKDEFKSTPPLTIAGVIGIASPTFRGSIAIAFPEPTFLGVMGKMLGETYTTITQDLEDGAGELLNIIYGHAKKVLNEQGHTIDRALPTVVRGEKINIRHMSKSMAIVLPFETEMGMFIIEVGADQY